MNPSLAEFIHRLPPGRLSREVLLSEETLLESDGDFAVYFVPFGYFPAAARVALVGITPGFEQMRLAYEAARDFVDEAEDDQEFYRHCGAQAGFGGPMRRILVEMLDGVGLHEAMGVATSADLFDSARDDVIRCSVLQQRHTLLGVRPPR